jgi:amino acid adenylation domain-containing protein
LKCLPQFWYPARHSKILSTKEVKHQVADTALEFISSRCCHVRFEERAARIPDAIALVNGSETLTYRELNNRANQLSAELITAGVGLETLVGIHTTNSIEAIIGILAILKAGGAFVPLEPEYPEARLRQLITHAELRWIVSNRNQTPVTSSVKKLFRLEQTSTSSTTEFPNPRVVTNLDNAACMLYTSGSTGFPKGVIRTHRAIVHRLTWIPFRADDVFCHNMSFGFGMSQERLFLPLMRGQRLVIIPDQQYRDPLTLAKIIASNGITDITIVPSMLYLLLIQDKRILDGLRCLRTLTVGGAPVARKLAEEFIEKLPGVILNIAYGSTESGSAFRGTVKQGGASDPVAVGRTVSDARTYILNDDLQPVKDDAVGDLYVSAPSISRGYWRDPSGTAEKFIPDPFSETPGGRMYRMGDRCRYLPDREIAFVGRLDRQVKIRGFRIELEEVENEIRKNRAIEETVVKAVSTSDGMSLIAYVVFHKNSTSSIHAVRRFLRERLPDYMIPSSIVLLDRLPRQPNEKVDVTALPPPPASRPDLAYAYIEPRNEKESILADIWAEVLEVDKVGIEDDFFDLGGDSIRGSLIVARIRDRFEVDLRIHEIFDKPKIAQLADSLSLPDRWPAERQ